MELEDPEDARILLSRAVECCPLSVEVCRIVHLKDFVRFFTSIHEIHAEIRF